MRSTWTLALLLIAGVDHVGIGADFYGATGDELVEGLEDVSRYPELFIA